MRVSRKLRTALRKTIPLVLLLSALLSAVNAYLSVSFSAPLSMNTHEVVEYFASSTHLTNSKTQVTRLNVDVAVVVPFHRCQALSRLRETFEFWHKHPPCLESHAPDIHLSLILYFSEDLDVDPTIKRKVLSLIQRLPADVYRCFDGIHFISARLSPTENIYPLGPCHQFYRAFPLLRNMGFSHWMLYEPDVIPLQIGWGDALVNLSSRNINCRSWWQLGSWPMYRNKVDRLIVDNNTGRDLHLNGNAIYCLLSPQFDEYRARVQMKYPPNGCAGPSEFSELGGYDHALYRFRLLPENREYMQDKLDRFVSDEFIINFGESGYDATDILRKHPSTMLVHGKYPFVHPAMKLHLDQKYATYNLTTSLEYIYLSVLQRKPTRSELHFFTRAFQQLQGDEIVMQCVLTAIISHCDRDNQESLLSSCGGQVRRVFEHRSKAILTGLFIRLGQRMPGPEAATYVKLIYTGSESCLSIVEKLCRLPAFFCPNIVLLDLSPHKTLYRLYDELEFSFRKEFVKVLIKRWNKTLQVFARLAMLLNGEERSCYLRGREFSATPVNYVMESSYLTVCRNASYDQKADMLSCTWENNTLFMSSPYECAEDINVNHLSRQLDC